MTGQEARKTVEQVSGAEGAMNPNTLWQFQCQKEGTLFYYQHGLRPWHLVNYCPLCGWADVEFTGRKYAGVDEDRRIVRSSKGREGE